MIKLLALDKKIDPGSEESEDLIELLSMALKARREAELRYRFHNAAFVCSILDRNPKDAEWKTKRRLESSKPWAERKTDLMNAEHDLEVIRTILGTKTESAEITRR